MSDGAVLPLSRLAMPSRRRIFGKHCCEYDGRLSNATPHSPQTMINFRCIPAGAECITISEAALPGSYVTFVPQGPEKGACKGIH